MNKLAGDLSNKWQRYSASQKTLLLYCLVLLVMLLLLPIIKLNYLNSTNIDTFTLFNSSMTKIWSLTLIIIGFLMARNGSYKFKKVAHQIFGFAGNDTLVNTTLIFMLLVLFFSVGDTIGLLKQNFSYRISTTSRFLVIGLYLIVGLIGSLAAARISHKKSLKSAEINISTGQHSEHEKESFHQQKTKDYGGLFGEEDEEDLDETYNETAPTKQPSHTSTSGQHRIDSSQLF